MEAPIPPHAVRPWWPKLENETWVIVHGQTCERVIIGRAFTGETNFGHALREAVRRNLALHHADAQPERKLA